MEYCWDAEELKTQEKWGCKEPLEIDTKRPQSVDHRTTGPQIEAVLGILPYFFSLKALSPIIQ